MNIKLLPLPITKYALAFGVFVFLVACSSDGSRKAKEPDLSVEFSQDDLDDLTRVKEIFYALPSPLETAMLIKSSGALFNEELLNPVENSSKYITNRSMALNLGIYTTDLSYASLFDQTQATIKYMATAKKLAEGLGVLDAIDNNTLQRLEDNVNNRDVIMDIISETFMNSSSFLKENDREAVAAVMLVGGWLEGLYIALNLVEENELDKSKLVERIIDQKLSLDVVMMLLDDNIENPDVAFVKNDITKIKMIFDQVKVTTTDLKVSKEKDVTTLKAETKSKLTPEVFRNLKKTVSEIRTSYIS
jgi:hypothetical protein